MKFKDYYESFNPLNNSFIFIIKYGISLSFYIYIYIYIYICMSVCVCVCVCACVCICVNMGRHIGVVVVCNLFIIIYYLFL